MTSTGIRTTQVKVPNVDLRSLALFLDNFTRYRQDKPLRNIVDQTVGY